MTHSKFEDAGYLSTQAEQIRADVRSDNPEWFQLAEDLNAILVRIAFHATNTVKTDNWAPQAVATRILLRASGTFQGAVLLAERGMTAEARILARSLIEDAFCIAAIVSKPGEFLALLKEDSEGSRKRQGQFIETRGLVAKGDARDKLLAAIDALGKPSTMNVKHLAHLGALTNQYLAYQRLSDDAGHTSASALEHHVQRSPDGSGWHYKSQPATKDENAATLHHILLGAMPIGVGITELLKDEANGRDLGPIIDRFAAMPPVETI